MIDAGTIIGGGTTLGALLGIGACALYRPALLQRGARWVERQAAHALRRKLVKEIDLHDVNTMASRIAQLTQLGQVEAERAKALLRISDQVTLQIHDKEGKTVVNTSTSVAKAEADVRQTEEDASRAAEVLQRLLADLRAEDAVAAKKPAPARPRPTVMYDGVNISDIPADAQAVACYAAGTFTNHQQAIERFPHARIVTIVPQLADNGEILDIETGDATADQGAPFILRQHARGVHRPGVYGGETVLAAVKADLDDLMIPRAEYRLWLAKWGVYTTVQTGFDAQQIQNTPGYDVSIVLPSFWD